MNLAVRLQGKPVFDINFELLVVVVTLESLESLRKVAKIAVLLKQLFVELQKLEDFLKNDGNLGL